AVRSLLRDLLPALGGSSKRFRRTNSHGDHTSCASPSNTRLGCSHTCLVQLQAVSKRALRLLTRLIGSRCVCATNCGSATPDCIDFVPVNSHQASISAPLEGSPKTVLTVPKPNRRTLSNQWLL